MEEEFRVIKDYENYSVSNFGNVINNKTGRILKPGIDGGGYYHVILHKDGIRKTCKIHRLLANTFIPNTDNKKCIDDPLISYINLYVEKYPITDFIPNPNTQINLRSVFDFLNSSPNGAKLFMEFW
jgi:hypothetical protein